MRRAPTWWTKAAVWIAGRAIIAGMSTATTIVLVARRHVDFGRVRGMVCRSA